MQSRPIIDTVNKISTLRVHLSPALKRGGGGKTSVIPLWSIYIRPRPKQKEPIDPRLVCLSSKKRHKPQPKRSTPQPKPPKPQLPLALSLSVMAGA